MSVMVVTFYLRIPDYFQRHPISIDGGHGHWGGQCGGGLLGSGVQRVVKWGEEDHLPGPSGEERGGQGQTAAED